MRRVNSHAKRHDAGAVAVIVSVLVAFGVIIGSLAISVDVGSIMSERRQLQNGADATALALAKSCAEQRQECKSLADARSTLVPLAGANANDGATDVTTVCGYKVSSVTYTSAISGCVSSGSASQLGECLPKPQWLIDQDAPYVQSYVATQRPGGGGTVLTPFARALTGSAGSSVAACSRAAWGPAGGTGRTIPLIMTRCAYDIATSGGTRLEPAPPYTPAPNSTSPQPVPVFDGTYGNYATKIEAHDKNTDSADLCGKAPNGQTYPGGFSWVQPPGSACNAEFNNDGDLTGVGGAPPPQPQCKATDMSTWLGTEVFVPIARSWTESGNVYHIDGVASFFVAGWVSLGGGVGDAGVYQRPSYLCPSCTGSNKYIWGWFTSGIKPVGTIDSGGPNLGASVVLAAG